MKNYHKLPLDARTGNFLKKFVVEGEETCGQSMFDLSVGETASQRMGAWMPALAGLATAGCVAWWTCPAPMPGSLSLYGAAALATRYVLVSALAGMAATWSTLILQGAAPGARSLNLRISAALVWLPPLALFLSQKSLWAGLASIVVGWQILKSSYVPDRAPDHDPSLASGELFRTLSIFPLVPSIEAICSAVCVEGGAFTAILGKPVESAALWGIGSALIAWSSNEYRIAPETESRAYGRRAPLLVAFALLFTLAGLMQYVRVAAGGGEVAASSRSGAEPIRDKSGRLDDTYKGVILLPEPTPHAVLVPPLPFLKHGLFTEKQPSEMSVPFYGVYWMFRWPQSQPPPDSYVKRGSPVDSGFRSNNRIPLFMEAHQNFGTLIDLSCCRRIQLAIRSADPNAGFITLELILTNTSLARRPSLSLGQGTIIPTRDQLPMQAVLNFDVPSQASIRQFDEVTIRFHRAYEPDRSAKVAIDRFVFVRRGL